MDKILSAISLATSDIIICFDADYFCKSAHNADHVFIPGLDYIDKNILELLPAGLAVEISKAGEKVKNSRKAQSFSLKLDHGSQVGDYQGFISPFEENLYLLIIRKIQRNIEHEESVFSKDKKFRILLESASQAIILSNFHGQIVLVNTEAEKLFGYSRDELENTPIERLIPQRFRDIHSSHRNRYMSNPQNRLMAEDLEANGVHKNGYEFPVEINLSSIDIYEGMFVMAFITDLTLKRKYEQRLHQLEKLEAVGQLAGGIAHDFNNVLAGIIGLTELAIRKIDKENPAHKKLNLVIKKADEASQLVRKLLTFSKQDIISFKNQNLNTIIENNIGILKRYIGENIVLNLELDRDVFSIKTDPIAIDQIITNLTINARDAMPDGGELFISTKNVQVKAGDQQEQFLPVGNYVLLKVRDIGIGIRNEVRRHIFEPFFSTKDVGEGTGLGLSTVYGVVKQHKGYIFCDSVFGEGTTFKIYFPVSTTPQKETLSESTASAKMPAGGNETILIVEDENHLLLSFKESLESFGYQVITASNGKEALKIVQDLKERINLVVSDNMMPKIGGVELRLLVKNINPATKFLLISAIQPEFENEKHFLKKPFRLNELAAKIRSLFDKP